MFFKTYKSFIFPIVYLIYLTTSCPQLVATSESKLERAILLVSLHFGFNMHLPDDLVFGEVIWKFFMCVFLLNFRFSQLFLFFSHVNLQILFFCQNCGLSYLSTLLMSSFKEGFLFGFYEVQLIISLSFTFLVLWKSCLSIKMLFTSFLLEMSGSCFVVDLQYILVTIYISS